MNNLFKTKFDAAVIVLIPACIGINYLGDWGTQFGKLIVAYKKWSSADRVAERGIEELVDIYVRFSDESEKEPSLNDEARAAFAELERGNEEYLAIWRYFKEISLREYMKTYELLGIEFDSFDGESFFTDKMPAIVEELREKGLLVQDDGAWIVDLAPYGMPPALILKRDGSTLYPTRDIAAAVWRKKEYDFDKCIYVTSAGQSLHFAQWFKVVELMGSETYLYLKTVDSGINFIARVDARSTSRAGDRIKIAIDANRLHFFDVDTEASILNR